MKLFLLSLLPLLASAQNLLLIGGVDETLTSLSSNVLVTSDVACMASEAGVADLPLTLVGASAEFVEESQQILMCGGSDVFQGEDFR